MNAFLDSKITRILLYFCNLFLLFGMFFFNSPTMAAIDKDDDFENIDESRPWRAPSYSKGTKNRRKSEKLFFLNGTLSNAYQFWLKIYTQYTSSQGVLHSINNMNKIHKVIDFTDIDDREDISEGFKGILKQRRADEVRDEFLKRNKGMSADDVRFQLGQKDKMEKAIFLSGRYIEDMEKIFLNEGLPIELTRLVFVESSFNVLAKSKVGASGLWQIMPRTASPHKMLSRESDLRNHPREATRLAARILRDNFRMLQSWPLAITGYNHGPSGVRNLVKRYRSNDLSEIINKAQDDNRAPRSFGFASQNFYASFLAALEVERNAPKYFPDVRWAQKLKSKEIRLARGIPYKTLLSWFKGDRELLNIYNPHLNYSIKREWARLRPNTLVEVPR